MTPAEQAAAEALCEKLGPTIGGFATPEPGDFEDIARAVIAALGPLTDTELVAPTCSAHGEKACELCSLNPGSCATDSWQCEMWRDTGMHWDTCPNRIRGYAGAMVYFAEKLEDQDKRQRAELSHFRLAAVKARYEREKDVTAGAIGEHA